VSPRQAALRLLDEYGADVQDMSGPGELLLSVWSPTGLVWRSTGGHSLSVSYHTDRPAGWRWLLGELRQGVEPCDNDDCETCHEADESEVRQTMTDDTPRKGPGARPDGSDHPPGTVGTSDDHGLAPAG
jgi:hypothetical protein